MKLHHVQLAMPPGGEDAARRFYGDVLGLTERPKPSTLPQAGVWFGDGTFELHLGVEEGFAPAKKAHPALCVDDLGPVADRVDAVGGEVRFDDRLPGYDRFYTDDPFGNRIEFLERVDDPVA